MTADHQDRRRRRRRPGRTASGGTDADGSAADGAATGNACAGAAVVAFLQSAEGTAAARGALRRASLPSGGDWADELVADCTARVLGVMATRHVRADNPAAYGTRVLQNAAMQLLRASSRLQLVDPVEGAVPVPDHHDHHDDPTTLVGEDVRSCVDALASGTEPWLVAAYLARVVFVLHPDAVPDHFPVPEGGANPEQASWWPPLAAAGRDDVFEATAPDATPAAVRRRRSRAVEHCRTFQGAVAAALTTGGPS